MSPPLPMDNHPIVVQPGHGLGLSLHRVAWGAKQFHLGTMKALCPGSPPLLELAGVSIPAPRRSTSSVATGTFGMTGGVKRL